MNLAFYDVVHNVIGLLNNKTKNEVTNSLLFSWKRRNKVTNVSNVTTFPRKNNEFHELVSSFPVLSLKHRLPP